MSAFTLQDIYDQITGSLARGNRLESMIPNNVRLSVQWVERNYNLKYMDRFARFTVLVDSEEPTLIELPNKRIKAMRFLRIPSGTDYRYLKKIEPQDQHHVPDRPDCYWQDGWCSLVLSAAPEEDTQFEIGYREYSAWSTDPEACHWLITNAGDLLVAQTLMRFARHLRDNRMWEMYKTDRDEAITTLLNANDEGEYSDQLNVMDYRGTNTEPRLK